MAKINRNRVRRRALGYGVVMVVLFAGVLLTAVNVGGGLPFSTSSEVRARFDDVGSLVVGDDVRIGNVRVGRVAHIALDGNQPVVTLAFDEQRTIYRNASATIDARSSLGQKYVDVDPGDPESGELGRDGVIATDRTRGASELSELLDALDEPTRDALGSALREVGGATAGRAGDISAATAALPTMLTDLGGVSRALAANDGAGTTAMLRAAESLSRSLSGRERQLAELADNLGTTLRAVGVDDGTAVREVLSKAPETIRRARAALGELQAPLVDTRVALARLRPGARALGQATPDLRGILREGVEPLDKVPGVVQQADPSVEKLTTLLHDARPLAPQLSKTLSRARQPVEYMSPYAPEIALFFTHLRAALATGDDRLGGHWLRVMPVVHPENLTGAPPGVTDPLVNRNPYPEPGEAAHDRANPIPGERR